MGNVKSCCFQFCPPNKNNDNPYNEHTRILNDPTDGTFSEDYYQTGLSNSEKVYGTIDMGKNKSDQTHKWNRALQKMSINVIDVSTNYIPAMEQSELMERQRAYHNKIAYLKLTFLLKFKKNKNRRLQRKSNFDYKKLSNIDIITNEDINLMNQLTEKISDSVRIGFLIDIQEDLVVQFNP